MIWWILGILAAYVLWIYVRVLIKRFALRSRLGKLCRANRCELVWKRGVLSSVFKVNGETDFEIPRLRIRASVITTPIKRARYHFRDGEYMDVIIKNFALFLTSRRVPVRNPSFEWDNVISTKALDAFFEGVNEENEYYGDDEPWERVLIIHPVPYDISAVKGTKITSVVSGEEVFEGVPFYTLSGFCSMVEEKIKTA